MAKKLQNFFNDFLPQNYRQFKQSFPNLTANQGVVASLLRICCEEENVKAIQLTFERLLGKPEKVITIKRTVLRTLYPDAESRAKKPEIAEQERPTAAVAITERPDTVVVDESNAPGALLKRMMDDIGEEHNSYAYDILDDKDAFTVAEVLVANLYGIAMRGSNLQAITMLFDYLDGAVADVVRLEGEEVVVLENYAETAPYDALWDEEAQIWYVELEAVK